jgi:hypothetical protein
MAKTVNECQAEDPRSDNVRVGPDNVWEFQTLSDRMYLETRFLPKSTIFFLILILELYCSKSNETRTQGLPQHKEQVPKRDFFFQIQRFPFQFWMNLKT